MTRMSIEEVVASIVQSINDDHISLFTSGDAELSDDAGVLIGLGIQSERLETIKEIADMVRLEAIKCEAADGAGFEAAFRILADLHARIMDLAEPE